MNKDQENEIIRLFKAGYKVKEIASRINLTYTQTKSAIVRMRKKGIEVKRWWQ